MKHGCQRKAGPEYRGRGCSIVAWSIPGSDPIRGVSRFYTSARQAAVLLSGSWPAFMEEFLNVESHFCQEFGVTQTV